MCDEMKLVIVRGCALGYSDRDDCFYRSDRRHRVQVLVSGEAVSQLWLIGEIGLMFQSYCGWLVILKVPWMFSSP